MRKMTDKQLQNEFFMLNERFFDDKLPYIEVRFGGNHPGTDGHFDMSKNEIHLSVGLRNFPNLLMIVLIHEMAHASMAIQGYRGYPGDGGHGGLFQVELDRLYKAGAYDSIL
jgi:hypothetical protein